MMKHLLPILLLLCGMQIQQANAQMSFGILQASDSTYGPLCSSPAPIDFYMYGWATEFDQGAGTVYCTYHFGDGQSQTVTAQLYGDFAGLNFFSSAQHVYAAPGNYTVMYEVYGTVTGGGSYYDSLIVQNEIVIADTCGTIGGVTFYDANGNCTFDNGEEALANMSLALVSNGEVVGYDWTNALGEYDFYAPVGVNYEVQLLTQGYTDVCPGTVQNVGGLPNTGLNFAVSCDSNLFDLTGSLSGWGFRPGFDGWLTASVLNNGCLPTSGTLTIELDPITTYNGMAYPQGAVTVVGSTVTIDFGQLSVLNNSTWFQIGLYTDPSAIVDSLVCFDLAVSPTDGDSDVSNNTGTYCFEVRNSWDPNDKAVSPSVGENGAVLPNTALTYHVRFQNTGTAEAVNIFVMDTIDANLDLSTFRVLATSHDMEVFMLEDRAVKFNFPNINLLDSTTNEPLSHGFITYSIQMNADLAEGTEIENTAHIFFDFNPAVVTNTTLSTIDLFLAVGEVPEMPKVSLYPNPTSGMVQLAGVNAGATVEVMDALGRVVLQGPIRTEGRMDVSGLPAGAYVVRVKEGDVVKMGRVVVQN
jgi:uncharacterized repeat protein (TIGR01451 family)